MSRTTKKEYSTVCAWTVEGKRTRRVALRAEDKEQAHEGLTAHLLGEPADIDGTWATDFRLSTH